MEQTTKIELTELARKANGIIHHLYLHHTGGLYNMNDVEREHYHICIEGDGTVRINTNDLTERKNHTWRRNTGSVGIALCCAYAATINQNEVINWGKYPPTPQQIISMAEVIAILATYLNLPIDRLHVLTHDEVAVIDNYSIKDTDPDMRWDLRWLDDPGTGEKHIKGGKVLRGLAIWKQQHGGI